MEGNLVLVNPITGEEPTVENICNARAFAIVEAIHPGSEGMFADDIPGQIRDQLLMDGLSPYGQIAGNVFTQQYRVTNSDTDDTNKEAYCRILSALFCETIDKKFQYQLRCLYSKLFRLVADNIKGYKKSIDIAEIISTSPYLAEEYIYSSSVNTSYSALIVHGAANIKDNDVYLNVWADRIYLEYITKLNTLLCKVLSLYTDINPDVYIRGLDEIYSEFRSEIFNLVEQLKHVFTSVLKYPMEGVDDVLINKL